MRDSEIGRDGEVPGALHEISEPMVIALLRASGGPRLDDRRPFASATVKSLGAIAAHPPA
jgi:hypothetical protein